MKLIALNRPEFLELVAGGLAEMGNYQWLDFGHGRQIVTPALLEISNVLSYGGIFATLNL
jgi:hypothetical protein